MEGSSNQDKMKIYSLLGAFLLLIPRTRGQEPAVELSMADLMDLGCWDDNVTAQEFRAMPDLYFNARGNNIWADFPDMSKVILLCASKSLEFGYKCFGVQHFGECWGSPNACMDYMRYGNSSHCNWGVGMPETNMVYAIRTECSGECQDANSDGECGGDFYQLPINEQTCAEDKLCCKKATSCEDMPNWHCALEDEKGKCPHKEKKAPGHVQDCDMGKMCCERKKKKKGKGGESGKESGSESDSGSDSEKSGSDSEKSGSDKGESSGSDSDSDSDEDEV